MHYSRMELVKSTIFLRLGHQRWFFGKECVCILKKEVSRELYSRERWCANNQP